ncbi:hypothetical protein ACLMJK_005805 [Lecanora helva]
MYFNTASLAFIAMIVTSTSAAPAPESLPVNHCGQATADRKADLISKGATSQDLAITIQETACAMNSAYAYGDNKQGDAANFGLFKNNWYTIRTYCSQFAGQQSEDFNNGAVLNTDDAAAIQCQHEQQAGAGDQWWARQRGGETPGGCSADPTGDIYRNAVGQITAFIDAGNRENGDVIDPQVTAC